MKLKNASFAFVFPNEGEANDFYKKVANRSKYASELRQLPTFADQSLIIAVAKVKEDKKEKEKPEKSTPTKKKKKGGKIDISQISGPVSLPIIFST